MICIIVTVPYMATWRIGLRRTFVTAMIACNCPSLDMKIAYDHQIFGLQKHGGISRYFVELVSNLIAEPGFEPTVIAPLHVNEYLRRDAIAERVVGKYLPFDFRGKGRIARAMNNALVPLAWLGQSFDIIHETYYSNVRSGRAKVRVLTIYDMIHELYPDEIPDSARVIRAKCAAVRRADHIICISDTTRNDATKILGINPENVSVIYLGCSIQEGVNPELACATLDPFALYVGHRAGYKNFQIVLEAIGSCQTLRHDLKLVAFGGPRFSPDEQDAIKRLGLEDRVLRVAGDDAMLRAYYRAARVFIYPSRYEGFGIPPLEAMAAGCPVICSTAPSIAEVVGDGAAYFAPEDSSHLGSLIERIIEDGQYCEELRSRGAQRVARYSWAKCATETGELYSRLAGRSISAGG